MNIYVGRWDLLPEEWEGYNGLSEKDEEEISEELNREMNLFYEKNGYDDNNIARYDHLDFEDTFNQTLTNHISSKHYWIRIFAD